MEDKPKDTLIPIKTSENLDTILKIYDKNDILELSVKDGTVLIRQVIIRNIEQEKQANENIKCYLIRLLISIF